MEIIFTQVSSEDHLKQILNLQKMNLRRSISADEVRNEGFVTCEHSFDLLQKMNHPHPHIIALSDDRVVGYCLVMSPIWRKELPVLHSMFEKIEQQSWKTCSIKSEDYIAMGQVCIGQEFRKKGLFRKMYAYYKEQLSPWFRYCITEVDQANTRSLNAHDSIGFQHLHSFDGGDGHQWELIIWDWRS